MTRYSRVLIITGIVAAISIYTVKLRGWVEGLRGDFVVYSAAGATGTGTGCGSASGTTCNPVTTRVIPYLVEELGYSTTLWITNTGTTSATISGSFYASDGSPSTIGFMSDVFNSKPDFTSTLPTTTIQARQTLVYYGTGGLGGTGWASLSLTGNVSVQVFFGNPNDSLVGTPADTAGDLQQFSMPANLSPVYQQGLALVNSSATDANVHITIYDRLGNEKETVPFVLKSNQQMVKLLNEIFFGEGAAVSGSITVQSDQASLSITSFVIDPKGNLGSISYYRIQ